MQLSDEYVDVPRLSKTDLEHLAREPSPKVRAALCEKICAGYNDKAYSERETALALEIIRLLIKDTSLRVRRSLSEALKSNPELPRDIAIDLANDHELVAEAILGHSPVLDEEDLLAIIHSTQSLRKLMAIAGRDTISAGVANALIDDGAHSVTMTVIQNPGAQIEESTFAYLLEEYYQDDSILEALVYRSSLPYTVAEKLFYLVGDHLRRHLSEHHHLRRETIEDITAQATESATLKFLSPWMGQQDIQQLVQEMFRQDRLTNSLIIRSLCIGDLRFFQTAMAKRANISVSNAKILLLDPHSVGFDACYDKAALPAPLRDAVRCLYHCALEETQLGRFYHEEFTKRVIEKIMAEGYDRSVDQMPTLISMLGATMQEKRQNAN